MDKVLDSYPQPMGSKVISILDHYGPPSYVAGGEALRSWAVGLSVVDWLGLPLPAFTLSGNYSLTARYTVVEVGKQSRQVKLQWFDAVTGLEVADGVDLSAEVIRLMVIGG